MRGDLVTIAMQGNFGKPRPALVIKANQFNAHITATFQSAPQIWIFENHVLET